LCLQPLLKDKLAELAVKYGSGAGSSSSKLVLHASDDEDGGSSDMDFGGDDEDDTRKRKGPKAEAAGRAAAAAKGKKGKCSLLWRMFHPSAPRIEQGVAVVTYTVCAQPVFNLTFCGVLMLLMSTLPACKKMCCWHCCI
jgi:hypothetical protein